MSFIDQWRLLIPESLASFARLAKDVEDIDFTYGLLGAGVLWPLREPVQAYDGDAADALQEVVGTYAVRILDVIQGWPDDRRMSARQLAAAAGQSENLAQSVRAMF
jgi:hypothetical protein